MLVRFRKLGAVSADEGPPPRPGAGPIYGPDGRPQFFGDPATDRFVASLLNLASEVWAQEERLLELEARAGSPAPDRDAVLKGFIQRVFAPLREDPG